MRKICRTVFSPDCYKLVLFVVSIAGVCPLLGVHMDPYLKLLHIYAAAVIVFDLLGERRILKNKGRTILFVFVLCYGVTLLCNPNLINFSGISNFCYYFACLALVYSYGENSAKWDRITSAIIVSLITAANLVGIWMFYTKFYVAVEERGCIGMYPSQNRLAGLFGNPNVLGMLCLAAICLCAIQTVRSEEKRTKILYAAAGAVNYITLLLANSRTQIFSVVLLCMILAFMHLMGERQKSGRVIRSVLAAVLAGVVVYFAGLLLQRFLSLFDVNYAYYLEYICDEDLADELQGSTIFRLEDGSVLNGRVALWLTGLKAFAHKPLFGCGMDNLNASLVTMGLEVLPVKGNLHNAYIEVLVDFGVVGFACLVTFGLVALRGALRFFRSGNGVKWTEGAVLLACVGAFVLDAAADSTLVASLYPTSTAFWFIMAQFVGAIERGDHESNGVRPEALSVWADKLCAKLRKGGQ